LSPSAIAWSALIVDSALRERLGAVERARYEEKFTSDRMASAVTDFLNRIARSSAQ
jgi:hypothetical protein